jgi:transcriptional regulatory protein ASH1
MIKRGKVMLDIYDEQGNVIGQAMSYRCLSCDCAMEVSR